MTPAKITVDDLKEKAEFIRDTAKGEAERVVRDETTKLVIAGVAVVLVTVSLAYYLGSHRR
jgi:hypothetical protein